MENVSDVEMLKVWQRIRDKLDAQKIVELMLIDLKEVQVGALLRHNLKRNIHDPVMVLGVTREQKAIVYDVLSSSVLKATIEAIVDELAETPEKEETKEDDEVREWVKQHATEMPAKLLKTLNELDLGTEV